MSMQWWIHGSENGIHRPIIMLYVNCVELRIYHEKGLVYGISISGKGRSYWIGGYQKKKCMQSSENIFEKHFSTVKNQFLYMHLHAKSASHSVIAYGCGEMCVCLCEGMPLF